jgi:hypothetical protein
MFNQDFDQALRAAMPAAESVSLDRKIDTALAHRDRGQLRIRRLAFAACGVAAIGAVFLIPSSAEARLQRIAGALDDVERVQMTRYIVDRTGRRVKCGVMDYEQGKWHLAETPGDDQYYRRGELLSYDPTLNVYVRQVRPDGPFGHNSTGIGLSALLKSGGIGSGSNVQITDGMFNGKPVRMAVIDSVLERTVIYADPTTDRPIEAQTSVHGRVADVLSFAYPDRMPKGVFDPNPKVRIIEDAEFKKQVVAMSTKDELAVHPLAKGRFVIRAIDVAQDGTVFVSYQAGERSQSWRGFRLTLTDDLGTEYAAPREPMMMSEPRFDFRKSPDGRLDQEIFVPVHPLPTWTPRKLTINGQFTDKGQMVQFVYGFSKFPDGTWEFKKFPNTGGGDADHMPPLTPLWTGRIAAPTCAWNPACMRLFDYSDFATDLRSQIFRADHLAQRSLNRFELTEAAEWLEKSIALKQQAMAIGESSYAIEDDIRQLESIRSGHMKRPPSLEVPVTRG